LLIDYFVINKVKANLSLRSTKHQAMKTHWGGGTAPRIPIRNY